MLNESNVAATCAGLYFASRSLLPCRENLTFGCHPIEDAIWVSHGCRGYFTCRGSDIGFCGLASQYEFHGAQRHYCSCARDNATRHALNGPLRKRMWEAAVNASRLSGPAPLPDAHVIDAAWNAEHVRSMQALHQRALSLCNRTSGREAILMAHPATVALSTCGAIMVPFGGTLLREFEAHLRRFVVGGSGELTPIPPRASKSGYVHTVRAYTPSNATAQRVLASLGVPKSVILRTLKKALPLDTSQLCFGYRVAVWNGYMEFILGELKIFPRVQICWMAWDALHVSTVVDGYKTLNDVLLTPLLARGFGRLGNVSNMAGPIMQRLDDMTKGSHIVNLDIKPKDILVRWDAAQRDFDVRLSDIYNQGRYQSVAGVLPAMPAACRRLFNLELPTTMLACGPMRQTDLARALVAASLRRTAADLAISNTTCLSYAHFKDLNASKHFLDVVNDDAGLATGQISVYRAVNSYYHMNMLLNGKPVMKSREMHEIYHRMRAQWSQDGSTSCPSKNVWDTES